MGDGVSCQCSIALRAKQDKEDGTPCNIPMSLNMPPPPPAAPMVEGLRDIWAGRLGTPEAGAPVLAPAVREATNQSPINNNNHVNKTVREGNQPQSPLTTKFVRGKTNHIHPLTKIFA